MASHPVPALVSSSLPTARGFIIRAVMAPCVVSLPQDLRLNRHVDPVSARKMAFVKNVSQLAGTVSTAFFASAPGRQLSGFSAANLPLNPPVRNGRASLYRSAK